MARPRNEPTVRQIFSIRQSLHERVMQALTSSVEGRVPYGTLSGLINLLLTEWLESRELHLAPYGGQGVLRGDAMSVESVKTLIERAQQMERGESPITNFWNV